MSVRGGNWNNGANAGVFKVNFNDLRTNANINIGGRPALPRAGQVGAASRGCVGARAKGGCFHPSKDMSWE